MDLLWFPDVPIVQYYTPSILVMSPWWWYQPQCFKVFRRKTPSCDQLTEMPHIMAWAEDSFWHLDCAGNLGDIGRKARKVGCYTSLIRTNVEFAARPAIRMTFLGWCALFRLARSRIWPYGWRLSSWLKLFLELWWILRRTVCNHEPPARWYLGVESWSIISPEKCHKFV